ncbi:MAG: hypothetical protein GY804_01320 [Alphaproteobacteria bacterium]|nr:hypothetical protein [Alphaproteobacteria bacterium]
MHFITDTCLVLGIPYATRIFVKSKWNFDFLSKKDWQALSDAWDTGRFVIDDIPSILFILVLFGFPIFILISIWLSNKIDWGKYWVLISKKCVIKKKIKPIKEEEFLSKLEKEPKKSLSEIRPHAVGTMPEKVGDFNPELQHQAQAKKEEVLAQQEKTQASVQGNPSVVQEQSFPPVPVSVSAQNATPVSKEAKQEQVKSAPELIHQAVSQFLEDKAYKVFKDVALGDNVMDFLAISEGRIVLVGIDEEGGEWLANEEKMEGDECPEWMSTTTRESPVNMVMQSYITLVPMLRETFGDDVILPINVVLILSSANIINVEEVREVWINIGASVVRHKHSTENVPKELDLFADILPAAKGHEASDDMIKKIETILSNA